MFSKKPIAEVFRLTALFAVFTVLFLFPAAPVRAQSPFGGKIYFYFPECEAPPAIWLKETAPTAGDFMYVYGVSRSYARGQPSHPGQWLLGMYSGWVPCVVGMVVVGGGLLIVYHGSSQ